MPRATRWSATSGTSPRREPGDGRLIQEAAATEDVLPTILAAVYGQVPAGLAGGEVLHDAARDPAGLQDLRAARPALAARLWARLDAITRR